MLNVYTELSSVDSKILRNVHARWRYSGTVYHHAQPFKPAGRCKDSNSTAHYHDFLQNALSMFNEAQIKHQKLDNLVVVIGHLHGHLCLYDFGS